MRVDKYRLRYFFVHDLRDIRFPRSGSSKKRLFVLRGRTASAIAARHSLDRDLHDPTVRRLGARHHVNLRDSAGKGNEQ
jgi:hypothetical protein